MRVAVRIVGVGVVALLMLPLAVPSAPGSDVEANRKLLEQWRRDDPEQYARLERFFHLFRSLTPEAQQHLRELDRQIAEEDSETQARLMRSLERYVGWLTRLPDDERDRILAAAPGEPRLAAIREARDRQWQRQLPKARQDQLRAETDPARRAKLLDAFREEERQAARDWADARRHWDDYPMDRPTGPGGFQQFVTEVKSFADRKLRPMLSDQERANLDSLYKEASESTDGPPQFHYHRWLRQVLLASDQHPVLSPEPGPARYEQLPKSYQDALESLPPPVRKRFGPGAPESRWPQYAIAVTERLRIDGKAPADQLGPCRSKDFSPAVQAFVEKKLPQVCTAEEEERLKLADGRWPDYPRQLHEIARAHGLSVPELGLPGPPDRWDRMRQARPGVARLPEPPVREFREFARRRLQSTDPNLPRLSPDNPIEREQLKREFWAQNQQLLQKMIREDKSKMEKRPKKPGGP